MNEHYPFVLPPLPYRYYALEPVSYTHLDVYKRQGSECVRILYLHTRCA